MNIESLNKYIKNYFQNDKTQRAILLTAPWGNGKSYYIKNELVPFLKNEGVDCVSISLYGVEDLDALNRNIYMEVRAKRISPKSEGGNIATMIGKTIIKGAASFFGVDISQSDDDLKKLYESIDLTGKLLIFEDLERINFDLKEFLGYVNNICEQDSVKVLLVANESEIIKYNVIPSNDGKKEEKILTTEAKEYLAIKEKTISDTIMFAFDPVIPIKGIIDRFIDNKYFGKMVDRKDDDGTSSLIRRIKQQMISLKCLNYRSLLFACQKIEDMFNRLDKTEYDLDFMENLLIGTICYSIRKNNGFNRKWDDIAIASASFGTTAYPLYKVVYDFIEFQSFDLNIFKEMAEFFLQQRDRFQAEEELQDILNYYILPEKRVFAAVKQLYKRLNDGNSIKLESYTEIATYLISIEYNVGFEKEIEDCLNLMIKNLEEAIEKGYSVRSFASSGIELDKEDARNRLRTFMGKIREIKNKTEQAEIGFNYDTGSIRQYYKRLVSNDERFLNKNGFANKLDINRLAKMLCSSTADEIHAFRELLQYIYYPAVNAKDYYACDIENLVLLLNTMQKMIDSASIDRIQRMQLNWLLGNLEEIIKRLKGED